MKDVKYLFLFIVAFALYLFTLHPAIAPYRDSGDLVVASYTFGIAHPPGYPLYIILGKIATLLLPFGSIAFRVNLLSALLGAAALVLLARTAVFFLAGTGMVFLSILFLAVSPAFWRLSQVSEMYSLNAFLAALVLFAAARALKGGQLDVPRPAPLPVLYGLGFLLGISTGGHQTIVFIVPGLLWLLWRSFRFSVPQFLYAGMFFLLGLSVYLFLPVRAAADPLSNWGKPDSLNALFRIMTRADYGGMRLHPEQSAFHWTAQSIAQHLWLYLRSLGQQFTWPAALVGLWGIIIAGRTRFGKFLLVSFFISGPLFVIFSNLPPAEKTTLPILEPHLVLPNIIFVLFIAAGLQKVASFRSARVLAAGLLVFSFSTHVFSCNYRGHFYAYDYGRNVLSTVEKNGILYDPDDATAFISSYLQVADRLRPDVTIAAYFRTLWGYRLLKERHPEVLPSREIASGQELSRVLLDHNRVTHPVFAELPQKFPQGYEAYPVGLLQRLSSNGEKLPTAQPFAFYRMRNRYRADLYDDFFTGQIISYYAAAHNNAGLALAGKNELVSARNEYFAALGIDPSLSASYNNLGTLAFFSGNYGEAAQWFSDVLSFDPSNPSAMYNLGLTFKAQKKSDAAEALFRSAWEKYAYPDAGNELGLLYLNSGRVKDAVSLFSAILAKHPRYLPACFNIGLALRASGDFAASRRYFEIYLQNTADPREQSEVRSLLRSLP